MLHHCEIEGTQYTIDKFRTMEGTPLALEFWALASEPLAALLPQLDKLKDVDGNTEMSDVLAVLDTKELGANISSVFRELAKNPDLCRRMFARTQREGKSLDNPAHYENIVVDGSWQEWLKALRRIVEVNGWLLFFGTLAE